MRRFLRVFLLLTPAFAADSGPGDGGPRLFVLKYADAGQLRRLFSRFSYPISSNRDLNVLTVAGPAAFQAQVEAAVKQFDVAPEAPKNIELAVYLITTKESANTLPVPKELGESYKAYRLADTLVIRARAGQPAETNGSAVLSQIRFRSASIGAGDKDRVISIDGLRIQLKAPDTGSLSSDVDVKENQPISIGKNNLDGLLIAVAKVAE